MNTDPVKALSVRVPWASLIACGRKSLEIRTWRTSYRGLFVLCSSACAASRRDTEEAASYARPFCLENPKEAPRGVTLALCKLVGVSEATEADETAACCAIRPGDFAWRVRVVRALPRVRVSGRLGFWTPGPDVVRTALAISL